MSVWAFLDVTQQHEMQRQLEELATQDHLTGLANRLALERHILQALPRARRNGNALAVGMLDIDDFKTINDTWGHEAGDWLLQELAKRLQSRLRGADMLARFGGDEFVLMIEDLDNSQLMQQLQVALKRIHEAVEMPFEVAPGRMVEVHMSLGLALFPMDAEDKDGLLRQADTALYQVKAHKHDRIHWWRLGEHSSEAPKNAQDQNFDPYGEDAVLLLNDMREYFDAVAAEFVEQFFDRLANYPDSQEILAKLSAEEMRFLKTSQAEHFRFLLASDTTREQVIERARQLGQVHALVGIGASLMVRYSSYYQAMLRERLSTVILASRKRYQLQQAIERRIQDDVPLEIAAAEALQQRYGAIYSRPLPLAGLLWKDIAAAELATLGALPGIQGAVLMRLNPQEKFFAEYAAGPKSAQLTAILDGQETGEIADPTSPRGQALTALAWRSQQIQSSPSLLQDSRYAFWRASVQTLEVRSNVAIPVFDHDGQVVLCANLYGAYVNQFESFWMRQFTKGVQWRWQNILQNMRGTDAATTLTEDLPQKNQE
jgi:diguanylate cyclase (GGDEF)-like protein